MQQPSKPGIKFYPNDEDLRVMSEIQAAHPYLTNNQDVIRYAIHTASTAESIAEDRANALSEPLKKLSKKG